jgi:hypothetical protein
MGKLSTIQDPPTAAPDVFRNERRDGPDFVTL